MYFKTNQLEKIYRTRVGIALLFSGFFLVFSTLLRGALLLKDLASTDLGSGLIFKIFLGGLFYDLVTLSYVLIPLAFYLLFVPRRWFAKPFFRGFSATFFLLLL